MSKGHGTADQRAAFRELEWRLCRGSLEYFIDRYGMIKMKDEGYRVFKLWPTQRLFIRWLVKRVSGIIVKLRQGAFTTILVHKDLHRTMFKDGVTQNFVSDSEVKAIDARQRIDGTFTSLPLWMTDRARAAWSSADTRGESDRGKRQPRREREDGLRRLACGRSEMRVLTSTARSVQGIIGDATLDELPLHREPDSKWTAVQASYRKVQGTDKGQLIVQGNGRGRDVLSILYTKARNKEIDLDAKFYDWRYNPYSALIPGWYEREQQNYILANPERGLIEFRRMYPTTVDDAFSIGATSFFRIDVLERLDNNARAIQAANRAAGVHWPIRAHLTKRGETYDFAEVNWGSLRLYEPPMKDADYVIACDPAGGTSDGSFAAAQVLRVKSSTAMVESCVYEARHEPDVTALRMIDLATWYNGAFLLIFSANHGHLVISRVKDKYANLYRLVDTSKAIADKTRDQLGYPENRATKTRLIDTLAEWLHQGRIELYDVRTIEELRALEMQDNGTTEPAPGFNDDLVDALAGCCIAAETRRFNQIKQPVAFDDFGNAIYS